MINYMRIAVTGALGHIGSKLIREIPSVFDNVEIIMVDNLLSERYCSLFDLPVNEQYQFIEEDILTADLVKIFDGADVVIHLAAMTNAADSFEIQDEVERVNYEGTRKVAEACLKGKNSMIYVSTTSVYGAQTEVVDEDYVELLPESPYAESKLKGERLLQELGPQGLRFVICRFGTVCGTSPGIRFHTAVTKFCWQAVMGQPLTVWSTALYQKRPYLSISDAMDALKFVLKQELFDNNIYNVLTENLTVNDVIEIIKEYIPEVNIKLVDSKIMNQLSYDVSNKKFAEKGFTVNGEIKEGIAETIRLLNGVIKITY